MVWSLVYVNELLCDVKVCDVKLVRGLIGPLPST